MTLATPQQLGQMTVMVPRSWLEANQERMAGAMRAVLRRHYPGHMFDVVCSIEHELYWIDHPMVPEGVRFAVKMLKDPIAEEKDAVRVAGEILERLNIPRGKLEDIEQYEAAVPLIGAAFKSRK